MDQKWYVIYAGDSRKHLAITNYFHSFNPSYRVWSPTQNVLGKFRSQDVIKAQCIFPGYLFVNCIWEPSMEDPVLELGGKFLTNPGGASPAEVSSDFLDGIKNLETQTDMEKVVEQTFDLTIGDRVEITNGPFLSGSGVITQIKKGKVLVELEIMKRFVEVEFEPQQCFKIK